MLCYGSTLYSYSAVPYLDVRLWSLKTVHALEGLNAYDVCIICNMRKLKNQANILGRVDISLDVYDETSS